MALFNHKSEKFHVPLSLLVAVEILLLIFTCIVASRRAYASTVIPGTYLSEDAAACGVNGFDFDTMDSGLKSWLFLSTADGGSGTSGNPNYPRYAAFRDTLRPSLWNGPGGSGGQGYYSTADGMLYATMREQAQADIASAVELWQAQNPSQPDTPPTPNYGNTDNGEYVRVAVRKSLSSRSNLTESVYIDGIQMGFGPETTYTLSPDVLYVNVPKSLIQRYVASTGNQQFVMFVRLGLSTSDKEVWFAPTDKLQIQWIQQELAANTSNNAGITFTVDTAKIIRQYSRQYVCTASFNLISQDMTYPDGSLLYQQWSDGERYATGYVSALAFDGTFTPEPEPVPEPEPEPVDPPYVPGEPPEEPTNPDTSGAATPTIDTKPITDRLDIIIGEIAAFEHTFWLYYRDCLLFFGEIYDMASEWLSDLYYQLQQANYWLQSIFLRLGRISSQIDAIDTIYRPTINEGNTVEQQLAHDINSLKHKFPFSAPWDIELLLLTLEAEPHNMVFELPITYFGQTQMVTVDLSVYHAYGSASRFVCMVAFVWWLIHKTRDLIYAEVF